MKLKYFKITVTNTMLIAETVVQKCSSREAFCKYVANLLENNHVEKRFLIKLHNNFCNNSV